MRCFTFRRTSQHFGIVLLEGETTDCLGRAHNARSIDYIKSSTRYPQCHGYASRLTSRDCAASTSVAGAVAGLVGLSGWAGFLFYLVWPLLAFQSPSQLTIRAQGTSILAGLVVVSFNSAGNASSHFKNGNRGAILAGLGDHILGYILCALSSFIFIWTSQADAPAWSRVDLCVCLHSAHFRRAHPADKMMLLQSFMV